MATKISLSNRLFAELFGTLMFVLIAAGSVVSASYISLPSVFVLPFVAVTTGLALALAVSITMNTSGGHLNPAVTIGALVGGRIKADEALYYIISQLAGAAIGALLLFLFFPQVIGAAVSWGTPGLGAGVGPVRAIAVEAVLTFFLVLAVYGTAIDERAPKIGGFGIGLTVMVDAMVGGPLTGAAMNIARWFGPALVSMQFTDWYVYIIGPVVGAVIAALVYTRLLGRK